MRARELIPIFEQIAGRVPSLAFHGRDMFVRPIGSLLRGIHVDPSAFSKDRFNLRVYLMPLCEKRSHLHFTFGEMIFLESEDWSMKRPNLIDELIGKITEKALPLFARVETIEEFANRPDLFSGNPHGPKLAAYCLARIGETRRAVAMIEEYLPKLDLSSSWQRTIDEDSRMLRRLLIYEPEQAAATLEAWENETVRNLGLEPFRRADA